MMSRQSLLSLPLLILFLAACTVPTPAPTVVPVSPTADVQPSPLPTRSATAPGSPTPASLPSPVATTSAPASTSTARLPSIEEAILILSPGPGSQLTSPVTVSGVANPTFENNLALQVVDESGAIVGTGNATIHADIGQRGQFTGTVEFTPPAQPQTGRLVVFDSSARDGHTLHLASVPVSLLPAGTAPLIQLALEHSEEIAILTPTLTQLIHGGTVQVSGVAAPTFEQTLRVSVLDTEGTVVGNGTALIQAEAGQPGTFAVQVAYTVAGEQPGSVQVYATSPRDGGVVHLASVEVRLQP